MKVSDMLVVDLDGNVVEGNLRPSSDTPTHLVLYKGFPGIAVVVEQVAKMAYMALGINPSLTMNPNLVEKNFSRKNCKKGYYGQK